MNKLNKLLELIKDFRDVVDYKINMQRSIIFSILAIK